MYNRTSLLSTLQNTYAGFILCRFGIFMDNILVIMRNYSVAILLISIGYAVIIINPNVLTCTNTGRCIFYISGLNLKDDLTGIATEVIYLTNTLKVELAIFLVKSVIIVMNVSKKIALIKFKGEVILL